MPFNSIVDQLQICNFKFVLWRQELLSILQQISFMRGQFILDHQPLHFQFYSRLAGSISYNQQSLWHSCTFNSIVDQLQHYTQLKLHQDLAFNSIVDQRISTKYLYHICFKSFQFYSRLACIYSMQYQPNRHYSFNSIVDQLLFSKTIESICKIIFQFYSRLADELISKGYASLTTIPFQFYSRLA